ncbi:MAG: polysaccharide pyruvyl transferase family protein [Ignavibacteria bacterium]|jgi:hypothetical protein
MKIGIATLYSSVNYGAYFQAYALQVILKNLGYDTEFFNTKTSIIDKFRNELLLSKNYNTLVFNIKKYNNFRRSWAKLCVSKRKKHNTDYYDAVILGSDEIWNLRNDSFQHLPLYFGIGINTKNLVTYAPSCDNTTIEQIRNDPNAQKGLSIINHFSARDENLAGIIETLTGKKAILVLDPTMLLGDFSQFEENISLKGYILIYTYGFNENRVKRVKEFARAKNLKIISVGFYYKWADMNLPASPFIFLGLIKNADYMITSTLHGVIFSMIYKKKFGVFCKGRFKVESILKEFDLSYRSLDYSSSIIEVIDKEIDFLKLDNTINEKRRQSMEYLTNALSNKK